MYSVGECRAFDRLYDRFAQARPGEQRPPPHPGTMGGVRSRLLPRLFEFPSRVAPADHGFLAEIRVVLRGRCTGQGCSEAGCDGGGVGKAATTRRSGTSHLFLLLMISLSGSFPNITIFCLFLTFVVLLCALILATRTCSAQHRPKHPRSEFESNSLLSFFLFSSFFFFFFPFFQSKSKIKSFVALLLFFFFYFLPRIGLVSWYVLSVFIYFYLYIYIFIRFERESVNA